MNYALMWFLEDMSSRPVTERSQVLAWQEGSSNMTWYPGELFVIDIVPDNWAAKMFQQLKHELSSLFLPVAENCRHLVFDWSHDLVSVVRQRLVN